MLLLIIVISAIAFTAGYTLSNPTGFVIADISEIESIEEEIPSFRIYTKAVCEDRPDSVVCHDELFARCEGIEYKLPKNEVNGKGIFSKEWEDPRNS